MNNGNQNFFAKLKLNFIIHPRNGRFHGNTDKLLDGKFRDLFTWAVICYSPSACFPFYQAGKHQVYVLNGKTVLKVNHTNGKLYYVAGLSMPLSTMWLQFCRSTSSRPFNFSHIRLHTQHPSISCPKSPVPETFSKLALLLHKNFYYRHILRCVLDAAVGKYLLILEKYAIFKEIKYVCENPFE